VQEKTDTNGTGRAQLTRGAELAAAAVSTAVTTRLQGHRWAASKKCRWAIHERRRARTVVRPLSCRPDWPQKNDGGSSAGKRLAFIALLSSLRTSTRRPWTSPAFSRRAGHSGVCSRVRGGRHRLLPWSCRDGRRQSRRHLPGPLSCDGCRHPVLLPPVEIGSGGELSSQENATHIITPCNAQSLAELF